ncbi:MAG: MCE family protein [Chitinispirillaceae bacterium]|nr:MCE family protein [Chitinispirillaceae bacterium]
MNDRTLGYIVIAMVVLFLILPVGYLLWQGSTPVVTRTIAFKNVAGLSFLSVQDPVSIQGVDVGTIRDITIKGTTAFIEIETGDTLRLHEDYKITVVAKGVMGDRYLIILPGSPQKRLVPADKLLYGSVAMGPDEALSHIGELEDAVHALMLLSEELKCGTADKKSLVTTILEFTDDIDSLLQTVMVEIGAFDSLLRTGIDSAAVLLDNVSNAADSIGEILPTAAATVSDLIEDLEPVVDKVDRLILTTDSLLGKIDDPELFIWKKHTAKVSENLSELRKLFAEIGSDSLELPVRLW